MTILKLHSINKENIYKNNNFIIYIQYLKKLNFIVNFI